MQNIMTDMVTSIMLSRRMTTTGSLHSRQNHYLINLCICLPWIPTNEDKNGFSHNKYIESKIIEI